MSDQPLRSALVLVNGPLGERLAGPEIRAVAFARTLRRDHSVTLAANRPRTGEYDGFRVVPATRVRVLAEAMRHDAVLAPNIPPYVLSTRAATGVVTIADQYDPHDLELASIEDPGVRERELRLRAAMVALQLRHADVVLCAGAAQRERLLDAARDIDRPRRPVSIDPVIVPFGITPAPPTSGQPLRARFPQIGERDTVVLWWGSVWRWLDAETPIRALQRLAPTRQDIKLVITAGRPPSKSAERFEDTEAARALATELGVIDRTVLFLDDWIPYEERHPYLAEADLGLTLHRFSAEAEVAARARYMDYLAAALPCVLGRGDETSAELEAAGFATLLSEPDPDELARALVALADGHAARAAARAAGQRLAAAHSWEVVGEPLRVALRSVRRRRAGRAIVSLAELGDSGVYYRRKLAHRANAGR